jgi:hypothetical protein
VAEPAADHGRMSALDTSYSYLRQFTPNVLAAIDFQGVGHPALQVSPLPCAG